LLSRRESELSILREKGRVFFKKIPLQVRRRHGAGAKVLERLLATKIGDDNAHDLTGPLHGIYALRASAAHLSGGDEDEAMTLAKIDASDPDVVQGLDVLNICVSTILLIADVLYEKC
jgi:hypothetical protein